MMVTLREGKAHLSALVERVSQGEEVVITVWGKPKARLCPITARPGTAKDDAERWGSELREARAKYSTGSHDSSPDILNDLREERS